MAAPQRDRLLWRSCVAVYPPSWRERYADEVLALLADYTPGGPTVRTAAGMVGGALDAWLRPRRHMHTPPGRVRASLAAVLTVWVGLAAAALVFGQLNQDQATTTVTPGHPITRQLFAGYTLASHVSVGLVIAGCAPLYLALVRAALHGRDRRVLCLLAAPAWAPALFLIVLVAISRAVRHPHTGVGAIWFTVLTALGILAGAGAAAGPIRALHRLTPRGRPVTFALGSTGAAVVVMAAGAFASAADLATVRAWGEATYTHASVPVIAAYGAFITVVLAVAITSGLRGIRASRIPRPVRS